MSGVKKQNETKHKSIKKYGNKSLKDIRVLKSHIEYLSYINLKLYVRLLIKQVHCVNQINLSETITLIHLREFYSKRHKPKRYKKMSTRVKSTIINTLIKNNKS